MALGRRAAHMLMVKDAMAVLVDERARLPQRQLAVAEGETTIEAFQRELLPSLQHPGPILDCYIVQPADDADPATEIDVFVELELAPGWQPPSGLRWAPVDELYIDDESGFAGVLRDALDVRCGRRPPGPLRPAWTSPGWFGLVSNWIADTLAGAGRREATRIVQHRHWGISALLRVETSDAHYWFKAVFPHFRHEAALTAMLDELMPGSVAGVVGHDADQGWLLIEHVPRDPGTHVDETVHRDEVATLVALQRRFANDVGRQQLLDAGCASRPLSDLPEQFAAAAAEPLLAAWFHADAERVGQIVEWLGRAVAAIDAIGVPDTLVHGDFHPNNIVPSGGRHVIIDWSDGAVSNPLLDTAVWAWWLRGRPDDTDALWRSFERAWAGEAWVDPMRAVRPVFEGVAAAYHFVSYAGILVGLDEHRRQEHADGLAGFFRAVDQASRSHAQPA